MKERVLAVILAIVLCVLGLAGCSKSGTGGENTGGENEKRKNENQENDSQGNDDGKDGSTAMGRYMEEEILLPELSGSRYEESNLSMARDQDGSFILFRGAYEKETLKEVTGFKLTKDKTWEEYDVSWLDDLKEQFGNEGYLYNIILGQDNMWYAAHVSYAGGKSKHTIIRRSEEGKGEIVTIPYLEETKTKNDYEHYPSVERFDVLEDGTIAIYDIWTDGKILLFSGKDGSSTGEIEASASQYNSSPAFKANGNQLITKNLDNTGIAFYNTETGDVTKDIEYQFENSGCTYDMTKDRTLVLGDRKGIHLLKEDGTLFETVVDGGLNSMSMLNLYLTAVYAADGGREEYYGVYSGSDLTGGMALMRYYFDETIAAVPEKEITVYSLYDNKTVHQAVTMFQKSNPDVRVNYTVAMEEEGGNVSDYIRALNTELLSENGADVIMLDGLPADSYIEKGVLADLSDMLEPLISGGEVHEQLYKYYKTEKGIYQAPVRFQAPLFLGREEALKSTESLGLMKEYVNSNPDKKYFKAGTWEEIVENLLAFYYDTFFTEEGTIDKTSYIEFLEASKLIADHSTVGTEDNAAVSSAGHLGSLGNIDVYITSEFDVLTERCQIGIDRAKNLADFFLHANLKDQYDCIVKSINGSLLPMGLAGLNNAGREKETAKEFIGFLLSEDVQKANVYDGFPVNTSALKKWIIDEADDSSILGVSSSDPADGGIELRGTCPPLEDREEILAMLSGLNRPIALNQTLKDMIITESAGYFDGSKTAGEAADGVMSKVNTYLSE